MNKHRISRVWVDETHVWAETEDGLRAGYAFAQWQRLAKATDQQRADYSLSYSGIHWHSIDEDLSFEGLFSDAGLCSRTPTEDSVYYLCD